MQKNHFRAYETVLDDGTTVVFGYDFERDSYLIVEANGIARHRVSLPQEVMWRIVELYPLLLKYQAQCAPDGVGAEL